MAKVIKMTEQEIDTLRDEFVEALRKTKMSDGKISYTKDFGKIEKRATLLYTEIAWLKQCMLVNEFDKEVAWHGVAVRGEEPCEYIIEDILVYPQEVTGATVNTDQEGYQTWLYKHPDEIFNNIRMQGHSHVNMVTTPSAVDTTLYDSFLSQLNDTMFYVFSIWNKRGERTIKIYDLAENTLFETEDVDLRIIDNDLGFGSFIDDAKDMVKTKTYTPPATTQYKGGSQVPVAKDPYAYGYRKGTKKKAASGDKYHYNNYNNWYSEDWYD